MKRSQRLFTWMGVGLMLVSFLLGSNPVLADNNALSMPVQQSAITKAIQNKQLVSTASQFNRYPDSLIAVAGTVNLTHDTPGSAIVLAGQANLGGRIDNFAMVSAGRINFNANVNKIAVLFGGNINSAPNSVMQQGGFIIGGDINLTGHVDHDITVIGGKVNLGGHFNGNVDVVAGQLVVSPNTQINGELHYVSAGRVNISSRAKIAGGTAKVNPNQLAKQQQSKVSSKFQWVGWVIQFVQLLVVLMILNFMCRATAYNIKTTLCNRPLVCLGMGALVVIVGFIAVPILVATVIGTFFALLWGLIYMTLLLLGYLYVAQSVGLLLMRCIGRGSSEHMTGGYWITLLAAAVGLIIIMLLGCIPVVGMWLVFASVLFGVGALVCTLSGHCRATHS